LHIFFEKRNEIRINVCGVDKSVVVPLYVSSIKGKQDLTFIHLFYFWIPKKWTLRDSSASLVKLADENKVKTQLQDVNFEGGVQTRQMLENTFNDTVQKNEFREEEKRERKLHKNHNPWIDA
jgi:hypothetical protein